MGCRGGWRGLQEVEKGVTGVEVDGQKGVRVGKRMVGGGEEDDQKWV